MSKFKLYRFNSSELAHSYEWHLPKIFETINTSKPKEIFEIGCGNGSLGKIIVNQTNLSYTGMDSSHEGIVIAKEQSITNACFLLGDVTDTSTNLGKSFDLCISIDVVEHIVDLSGYFYFIKQHMKPDGTLFITTTYHSYLKWLLLAILGRVSSHVDPLWPGGRTKFFNSKQLKELFHQHGFTITLSTGGLRFLPSSFYVIAKLKNKSKISL